jgi:hypothetical protein
MVRGRDYTGDDVDETTAQHCIAEADRLIDDVSTWRRSNRGNVRDPPVSGHS